MNVLSKNIGPQIMSKIINMYTKWIPSNDDINSVVTNSS